MVGVDIAALSGITGSISIACWVVVFSPQIIENFRRSSAEGLSITFVVIWLLGDVGIPPIFHDSITALTRTGV